MEETSEKIREEEKQKTYTINHFCKVRKYFPMIAFKNVLEKN